VISSNVGSRTHHRMADPEASHGDNHSNSDNSFNEVSATSVRTARHKVKVNHAVTV
jgi:hypothetical protein